MNSRYRWIAALAAVALLHGCGGGGGSAQSGGTGGTGVAVLSSGVMTKGSVILNGVRYEDTAANIVIDDKPKTAASLQSGMVVSVRGSIDAGGRNGTAQQVEAQIEVRGTALVTPAGVAANPQRFDVLGQIIIVDDVTVLSNVPRPITVALNNTLIEVHGLRDAAGNIRATRLEATTAQMADSTVDEIRGVVSGGAGTNPTTFSLGTQAVSASGASISPTGATYSNGSVVEVHCTARPCVNGSGQFVASRIDVEDAEDVGMQPSQGQRFEVEGLISGFGGHPGNFSVAGTPVTTTASTSFEGGISTDLANDIRVEAEGTWNGSRLMASKIEFIRSVIRLQGFVTTQAANTFTLDIAGRQVNVETDDFTDANAPLPANGSATCVQVRGQRKAGGPVVVMAGEIRVNGCGNSGRPVLQAPVEVEAGTVLTLLGFPIGVGNPTDTPPYQDLNGNPLSQAQFLAAVSAADPGPPPVAGTLVKVIFNTGLNTVRQVELED